MKDVDEVRRRVQRTTLERRGHKGDPLYEVRRLLRRRADRLSTHALGRINTALAVGDPNGEVARLGRTLATWRREYLAYFDTARTSNGPTEAINLLVERIRRIGHGYRRFDHYRLRLLLHCGIEWPTLSIPRIGRRRPTFVA